MRPTARRWAFAAAALAAAVAASAAPVAAPRMAPPQAAPFIAGATLFVTPTVAGSAPDTTLLEGAVPRCLDLAPGAAAAARGAPAPCLVR
jgi:hypothetical protein